jgi:dihydrodipicolinate synthase/N-acetylneuraminate lyase
MRAITVVAQTGSDSSRKAREIAAEIRSVGKQEHFVVIDGPSEAGR